MTNLKFSFKESSNFFSIDKIVLNSLACLSVWKKSINLTLKSAILLAGIGLVNLSLIAINIIVWSIWSYGRYWFCLITSNTFLPWDKIFLVDSSKSDPNWQKQPFHYTEQVQVLKFLKLVSYI